MTGLKALFNLVSTALPFLNTLFMNKQMKKAGKVEYEADALKQDQNTIARAMDKKDAAMREHDASSGMLDATDPNLRD